ncbi:hypothetical protein M422DRAFT_262039 [Sphaerobolus stellatus SS14]|uniref:Uncharacterized protein n=1 Tax=Sphaerobolus stellatus (strain SS14) TaxID=990650 RepID=A0A0C9VDG0_SPHS4|nr:hypothetical protein M422DRAFT_262039 [Sphaerobolus stellatus SS14]
MDNSNWEFLDRINTPKLRILRLGRRLRVWNHNTDEIMPFLLRDMTFYLFSTITSLQIQRFTIDYVGLQNILKACSESGDLTFRDSQITHFSEDDVDEHLFGSTMYDIYFHYT